MKFKEILKTEVLNNEDFSLRKIISAYFFSPNKRIIILIRFAQKLREKKIRFLPGLIQRHIIFKFSCYISLNSEIGLGVKFPHPTGIVIGDKVRIGKNCIIYQQVTFGGKKVGDALLGNYPLVKDNVVFFAGAKIIGNIEIGSNAIIAANSVVLNSIPSNCIVAGVPGVVKNSIKQNEKNDNK